jgi:hypothetical protein
MSKPNQPETNKEPKKAIPPHTTFFAPAIRFETFRPFPYYSIHSQYDSKLLNNSSMGTNEISRPYYPDSPYCSLI